MSGTKKRVTLRFGMWTLMALLLSVLASVGFRPDW